VKSIVCDECGQRIRQPMENTRSINSVAVDSKASTVRFQVKGAIEMGMGADCTLSDVKIAK